MQNQNTILIGDAAHLVDPWLGEGLYYALASGQLAAKCIIESEQNNDYEISHYSEQIHSTLVPELAAARKLSLLINLLPLVNVLALKASPTLQQMIIDLLRGEISHTQLWKTLKKHFPKLIWKILRGK